MSKIPLMLTVIVIQANLFDIQHTIRLFFFASCGNILIALLSISLVPDGQCADDVNTFLVQSSTSNDVRIVSLKPSGARDLYSGESITVTATIQYKLTEPIGMLSLQALVDEAQGTLDEVRKLVNQGTGSVELTPNSLQIFFPIELTSPSRYTCFQR